MQARIINEVLKQLRIPVEHHCTSLAVTDREAKVSYISGFTDNERDRMRKGAASWIDKHDYSEPGFRGHVLNVTGNGYLIDSALDQASAPDRGMYIPPDILIGKIGTGQLVVGKILTLKVEVPPGNRYLHIDYIPREDRSYEYSEAWDLVGDAGFAVEIIKTSIEKMI